MNGDNAGREGAGRGARARVKVRRAALGIFGGPDAAPESSSSESGEEDPSPDDLPESDDEEE